MADPTHVDYIPRIGRGYAGSLPYTTIGEMWDSFMEFRDAFIGVGCWGSRPADRTFGPFNGNFAGARISGAHAFNRIADTSGTVVTEIVYTTENAVLDSGGSILAILSAPGEVFFESVKNRLFWAGANNAPIVWNGTTVATWGAEGPIAAPAYKSFAVTDSDTKVTVGTASVVGGGVDATVTWVSGTQFTTGTAWIGKTIVLDGVEYAIATVTNATHLELTINYAGSTATVPFTVGYGSRSWIEPPKYAYAYYNPTTGHMTNASPTLVLSEQQRTNVAVFITAIATNSTLYGYGYTKIVVFRNAQDGGSLSPLRLASTVGDSLGMLNNQFGPLGFQDEQGDEERGEIIGDFDAPTVNDPCPGLKVIAYHDGRFWGIEEDRPWILRYSGDSRQIPLGVPEECWPDENFLPIGSPDGYGLGLKEIGSDLLVTTERYTYVVNGSNGVYELARIATRGLGTTQYGIAEHPGDSSEQSASAIYVGRDRRLWRHFSGGRIEELGKAIQQRLDACKRGVRHPYRVHVFPVGRFWMMALGIASNNSSSDVTGYDMFLYDFDQQTWLDWGFFQPDDSQLVTSFFSYVDATSGDPQFGLTLDAVGGVTRLLIFPGTHFEATGILRTQFYGFDRPDVKKSMQSVVLEVGDPDDVFTVTAYYDGYETPYVYRKLPTVGTPRHVQFNQITFVPAHGPMQWHVVSLKVTIPAQQRLYRIQPWFTPESTTDAGTPV